MSWEIVRLIETRGCMYADIRPWKKGQSSAMDFQNRIHKHIFATEPIFSGEI
jgi:hypothetical protein